MNYTEVIRWLGPRNHRVYEPWGFDIRHHQDYTVAMHQTLSLGAVVWWRAVDHVGVRLPLVKPKKQERKVFEGFLREVLPAPWGIAYSKKGGCWVLYEWDGVSRVLQTNLMIVFSPEGFYFVGEGAIKW